MGAWGIKALERDEGLDVLDILKNEYVPEHPVMDLGEMIELMKEEVMLGADFSQIDFLFDNTAMALAELYFQWKDNGKLDYDHEEAIWDKVTGFTASKEALAFLLRQLTDIKNEVPDEDGIREIVDLWKNEDSGEIAPAWLEHLNQLIDRLDSEQEARQMYIKKYWGNFIGGSDDSLNLVAFLEDQKKEEIPLSEIFSKIGLDKQNWDFRQTVEYLEFTHSDGVEMDFHFAIDVVTDLAAILLECSVSGSVNLQDLDEYNTPARRIRITATPEEHDAMNKALADFVHAPLEYDLSEMMDNEEIQEMARDVEALRKELYEAAGRNRDYYVKAEDMKNLLPDWEGADGCIATNRITVEGCKVGYCYREKPDGDWDSGWRFTAGDESEAYMDDPNNAGIYKLNTICNDDPDIIPLLNTPAPCAFARDENGVFQPEVLEPEEMEEPDMDILEQCQKWHEEDKHQKIVDALEAIPAEGRTPEMDMELARAYNNLADPSEPEGRKLLHRALELMQSHEEELGDTYSWNFRMGYAYYYLDQEGRALRYFEKALELHPGDDPKLNTRQDMEELIDSCKKSISLPQFSECFREQTEDWWETFAEMEAELRQMMDEDKDHTRGAELVAQMEGALNQAFDEISFEMGFNGKKHELILTPEGDKVKLFELVYFQKHAPKEVLEHWNILVGRQPIRNIGLRTEDGWDISGEDVQIWLEEQGENSFAISAYCEKLLPMLREEEGRAWWMLTTLTDQMLGEIPHMRYIGSFDVLEKPKAEPSFLLSQLPDMLKEKGVNLSTDPEAYLDSYLGYKIEPNKDPDADWRLDVMVGSTNCVPLINGYLNADNDFMDDLHADGAVAGFFCYYPADIDDYALKYFGPSRYHSNEFQQEAYLFIPFDEKYYQAMAQVIEERFENWQGQDFDEDTLEPSEVAHAIMEYLDCECTYFPSMADDDPIMSAYSYAQRLGVREGFVPVLIQADDETLLECLVMNADSEHDADFYEFDLKTVTEYRKKVLSAPIKDGKAILEELTGQRKEEAEDDDLDWEEEVLGEMEGGEPNDRFANYWNDDTGMTYPLILAKIPVKNPWEIFAYLPFGNWNECPDTPDLMAVAKYWFEQHGAIPAAMSHDELEFELPTPISKERAMEVAVEQYGFCPDLDQNEDGSIGSLADVLWQSTVWYFWWD